MTAPARMTPEREAELRAAHTPWQTRMGVLWCSACNARAPYGTCEVLEALDALAAERAHAQQVEVMHSSAAVLGYVVYVPAGDMTLGQKPNDGPYPTLEALRDDICVDPDDIVAAVVRVGTDGRIGSGVSSS